MTTVHDHDLISNHEEAVIAVLRESLDQDREVEMATTFTDRGTTAPVWTAKFT